ncbi:MAG: chorismate lyase [Acidiferrobacterales bacterium]|nr:chorismate lyase [Acidiferrobacterales bacterium]
MSYQQLTRNAHWQSDVPTDAKEQLAPIKPWLLDQGSLTAALISLSNDNFKVVVLNEEVTTAYQHEQQKLNFAPDQKSQIREVELHIHDQAVVFARSIIPLTLVDQQEGGLGKLGTKPLGHLLFKEGKPRVSKRDFAAIEFADKIVHARRTPYQYQGHHVLVSEFFLPSFLTFV